MVKTFFQGEQIYFSGALPPLRANSYGPGIEKCEKCRHLKYVRSSVDNKTSYEKSNKSFLKSTFICVTVFS